MIPLCNTRQLRVLGVVQVGDSWDSRASGFWGVQGAPTSYRCEGFQVKRGEEECGRLEIRSHLDSLSVWTGWEGETAAEREGDEPVSDTEYRWMSVIFNIDMVTESDHFLKDVNTFIQQGHIK